MKSTKKHKLSRGKLRGNLKARSKAPLDANSSVIQDKYGSRIVRREKPVESIVGVWTAKEKYDIEAELARAYLGTSNRELSGKPVFTLMVHRKDAIELERYWVYRNQDAVVTRLTISKPILSPKGKVLGYSVIGLECPDMAWEAFDVCASEQQLRALLQEDWIKKAFQSTTCKPGSVNGLAKPGKNNPRHTKAIARGRDISCPSDIGLTVEANSGKSPKQARHYGDNADERRAHVDAIGLAKHTHTSPVFVGAWPMVEALSISSWQS